MPRMSDTTHENTWCPGCGNFAIFNAFKRAVDGLVEDGKLDRKKLVMNAGIGCHAKIFDYLAVSGLYGLHGRSLPAAQGMKYFNPELTVVDFSGDGDGIGEGIAHTLFAAKRNADLTVILHDNAVYGLTTGQASPISPEGFKGPSTPRGSVDEPLHPLALMLESGATFVARAYSAKLRHMVEIMQAAMMHKGFAFVDILQPCVSYYDTYDLYNETAEIMEEKPGSYEEALALAKSREKMYLGIFWQEEKETFHDGLYGDRVPAKQRVSREERVGGVGEVLAVGEVNA